MRTTLCLTAAAAIGAALGVYGQAGDPLVTLQQQLISEFPLTTMTADKSDVAQAGAVLVLQKPGLAMYSIASPLPPMNTYKHGKFSKGVGRDMQIGLSLPAGTSANDIARRTFVNGEKFWVSAISAQKDAIVFRVVSDPFNDVRYWADLKLPLEKGAVPTLDQAKAMIAQVIAVDTGSATQASAPAPTPAPAAASVATPVSQQQAAASEPPPSVVKPPPPPPKGIAKGDTKDQVEASFGQPQKTVTLGAKEIYYYPDMKVIFLNGKVSDVQ